MDLHRIKSLRIGSKAAVTKTLKKLEDEITVGEESSVNTEQISLLLNQIEKKKTTLEALDEQLFSQIETEEITDEILDLDEYYLELESKIRKYAKYLKPDISANSILRTNAPEYVPSSYQTQHMSHSTCNSTTSSQNHRLPKLSLPNFNGDILEWPCFWDSYESTIHLNSTLTDVQKFSYLKSLLKYDAANVITGLTMTNANYYKAIELLTKRYGRTHKVTNAYMRALLDLPAPTDSLESLRSYNDKFEAYIRGLESQGQSQEMFGSLLIPVILGKLPPHFRENITRVNGSDDWHIQDLRDAIAKEISIKESRSDYSNMHPASTPSANFVTGVRRGTGKYRPSTWNNTDRSHHTTTTRKKSCLFCTGSHSENECKEVVDHEKRSNIIKEKKLCFNCFGPHRIAVCQSKYTCKHCHRKHHSSLCTKNNNTEGKSSTERQEKPDTETSMMYTASEARSTVLLKTAVSPVVYGNISLDTNILFDEGAQRSFITQELAAKLNVNKEGSESLCISTFGDTTKKVRNLDKTTVYLRSTEGELIPIKVLIVPDIASPIQNHSVKSTHYPYLRGLQLAHPGTSEEHFEISLLIGGDFYWDIVQDRVIKGNGPTAVSSRIGYLLSGPISNGRNSKSTSMMNILVAHKKEELDLEKFWKLESMGIDAKENETEMTESMENFMTNSIRLENGRYTTKLPWIENAPELPSNKETAQRRTASVIRRLTKDPEMFRMYGEIIADQEKRGFIERIDNKTPTNERTHYIPHHPVRKESATTPIRIVYNCSCKANSNSPCLNDCLASYPPLMTNLTEILISFRIYKYAITADIEKAFLQIALDTKDRDATRFFWLKNLEDPDSPLITYRFKVLLFGATCSPFILSATLMKHFKDNPSTTSTILEKNIYVDNVLTSFPDEQQTLEFYSESRKLLSNAGFNLRSWNSNCSTLKTMATQEKSVDNDSIVKILGMNWDTESDNIVYQQLNIQENNRSITKREVLRQSSSIFDPLGIITPVTVKAKLFIQNLWKAKLDWDEMLPHELEVKWQVIAKDIEQATKIIIPRMLYDGTEIKETSLHIFVDASQNAYGACAYLVTPNSSQLIMAKNRIAPVNTITLPRLELMAALVGARLANHVLKAIPTDHVFMWSDSQIVLSWLKSSKTLKPFIANRLKEIKSLVTTCEWNYCPTYQNPSDLLTRGITTQQLSDNNLWMNGPQWILNRENWPTWKQQSSECNALLTLDEDYIAEGDMDMYTALNVTTSTKSVFDIDRFSSLQKLIRVTVYVQRFITNLRNATKRKHGIISVQEQQDALTLLIRTVQNETFQDEMDCLSTSSATRRSSLVRQLKLYLDENGILRSAGRIHNAPLEDTTKYPILLPTHHRLTSLIVNDAHLRTFHSGLNSTISYIQQKYWIPRSRQCVKSQLRKCIQCNKISSRPYRAPDPPPLPKDRVNYEYPFSVTGVDYTGALYTKGQNETINKTYICLFTCAATRAVHLEVVTDLSEESFLLAFKRFVARRSVPRLMMSDNGSAFKAAAERITRSNKKNRIAQTLADTGTEWKFIPVRAPWFGGYWERLIGLTKRAIKTTLGKACVSLEMLTTIVTEIEGTMNNRPITYISTDIKDASPLTPSHLLYGRRLDSLPPLQINRDNLICDHVKANRNLHRQCELIAHFRERWKHEYLTSLREFHRTSGNNEQSIHVGDIVQIQSDCNRIMWKLAIVQELIRGNDGLVRSAVVKTDSGITNRPIVKLFPLEIHDHDDDTTESSM